MTHRSSSRDTILPKENSFLSAFKHDFGDDSYYRSHDNNNGGRGRAKNYTTRAQLLELDQRILTEKDREILHALHRCRYLTSGQIRRLFFTDNKTQHAATRATNCALAQLQEYGLITSLGRRIGGKRSGSGALVRLLTENGNQLLHITSEGKALRRRFFEPAVAFLRHTILVAEGYIQVVEICRQHGLEHIKTDIESACWRSYTDEYGKAAYLKPDLFSVVVNGDYEDHWFIEIDCGTESYPALLEKCRRYAHYYKSGLEQKAAGVFPYVVWVVPNISRKEGLLRNIAERKNLLPKDIFLVITPEEFEVLIPKGADALTQKEGEDT